MKTRTIQIATLFLMLVPAIASAQTDCRTVAAQNHGTLTSPLLRRDATATLRKGLTRIDHCPSITVTKMTVLRFVDSKSPWYERWTVADCKRVRDATMRFTPTADGGADMAISLSR